MTVLVTGATGSVGRHVVRRLVDRGERVRALTRQPRHAVFPEEVEVREGDLEHPTTLESVWGGVDSLYLFPAPDTARAVVRQAREAGVQRVVVLSSGAVTSGYDTDFHLPVEQAVEASGMDWTHVRAGEFARNKLALWGPPIRTERVVRDPLPEAAWYPVHEKDVADVAVLALTEDGHAGQAYTVNGPELLTHRQQVTMIAEAIGEEIRFEVVTAREARAIYLRQGGFAADNADFLLGFEDYGGGEADRTEAAEFDPASLGALPTAAEVTGKPARTFAQWAADHAQDFTA